MKSLTWYRGTILPYASLWSILYRVTWLNDLRFGDFYKIACVEDVDTADLLIKKGGDDAIIKIVAEVLDEPYSSFSDVCLENQLPRWLFPVYASNRPRWCQECLRLGYHTWLMSINLVKECPIHHVPLRNSCIKCGAGFNMSFRGLVSRNFGCNCGTKGWVSDPESIRVPALSNADIDAWSEVATWIQHTRNMCVNEDQALPVQKIQLALTERWCADLGIRYPSCFASSEYFWSQTDSTSTEWMSYKSSTPLSKKNNNYLPNQDFLPRLSVYRAMSRHLRRQAFGGLDNRILEAAKVFDPFKLAIILLQKKTTRDAFIEMLWTRALEDQAYLWRWPRRNFNKKYEDLAAVFGNFTRERRAPWRYSSPPLNSEAWLAYHNTAMECLLAWGNAVNQVRESIENHWADWIIDDEWMKGRMAWYAAPNDSNVVFAGFLKNKSNQSFSFNFDLNKISLSENNLIVKSLPNKKGIEFYVSDNSDFRRIGANSPGLRATISEDYFYHQNTKIKCFIFDGLFQFVSSTADGAIRGRGVTREEALEDIRRTASLFCMKYGTTTLTGQVNMFGFEKYHLASLNHHADSYPNLFSKNPDHDYSFRYEGWPFKHIII